MVESKNSSKKTRARSLEETEKILDNIPALIFYKDYKNNLIRVNKYFADAQKTTKDNLAGKNCFDIYPKEVAQAYFDDDLEVIKSKKPKLNIIEPWELEEGRRWINTSKIPIFDENNKCIGIIGFSTDVTKQVKVEQKIKQAREQLDTIFSNLKDTVFVISEDYKVLFKNDTAQDLFGSDLIGKDCYVVIKDQNQPCTQCPIKKLAETDMCQTRFEQCLSTPFMQEAKIFDIIASQIEEYNGKPALVEVLRDITEKKSNDVKIANQNRILEAINDLLQKVLTTKSEEELVQTALSIVEGLTNSKFGFIGELNDEGSFDTIAISNPGWDTCNMPDSKVTLLISDMEFRGIWSLVLTEEKSLIINEPSLHPARVGIPEGYPSLTSFMGVPLKRGEKTFGMIALANKEGGYKKDDMKAIEAISVVIVEALLKRRTEIELQEHRDHLDYLVKERTKELECLYNVSKILEDKKITKEIIIIKVLNILHSAWQFPDVICARIQVDNKEYKTENYMKTKSNLSREIFVKDKKVGFIEVSYLEEMPSNDEGPFLKEEKNLIDEFAKRLGTIFEHIAADLALKESEEWLSTTLKSIGDAVIATDSKGNIRYLNPVAESLTGWSQSDAINKPVQEVFKIINEESHQEVENPVDKVIREGVVVGLANHTILISKDGREIPIDDSGAPIKDKDGQIIGAVLIFRDVSERRRREIEIKDSVAKFKGVFESRLIGTLFWNAEGEITDANETFLDMMGYTKDEVLSGIVCWKDMTPPEYLERDEKLLQELATKGYISPIEKEYYHKDGHRIPIILGAATLQGSKVSGVAFVLDITERKKAEEEMLIKDIAFNASLSAQSTADVNGIIDHVNPAFLELWGYKSKEEAIGGSVGSFFVNPEDAVPVLKAITEKGKWEGEFLAKRSDGSKFISQGFASAIYNKNGEHVGFQSANLDVTKRREVEKRLKEETEKAKKYLDIAGVILVVLDKESNIVLLNKRGYKILQYEEGELLGKNWIETCIPIHNRKELCGVFEKLMRNELEQSESYENSILTKSGEEKIIAWNNTIIHDNNGKIIGTLSSGEDITERKKAEAELRKTMKELKNSNTELEQFAYVASHDLQEPLRMVASFTQLLQDRYKDKLDEDANDFINYAVDGATRMQNLINDLLIFSRIGSRGKSFKITDMNVVIESVLNNFRQLIKETNSMIIYDPLPVIEADESQMMQLFQNLISNGIKFRSEKDPIIHVTAEIKVDKWIFTVADNGIGIDNNFFDRIFTIFQRLHKKSEYGGTGIGLPVCKKIVQRHGGKIWVDSEVGKGSSFHVSIKKRK